MEKEKVIIIYFILLFWNVYLINLLVIILLVYIYKYDDGNVKDLCKYNNKNNIQEEDLDKSNVYIIYKKTFIFEMLL